ncbi:MAG TPA: ABC transporter substrate-binding protein [Anaerolineae bacterium]|nr:ABC transporter substrate-binding protein [Anaerolineae bacterium]
MRKWSLMLSVLLVVSLAGCGGRETEREAITLPMGYVADVQFSPIYMGLERGYFQEAGYDITLDYRWETDGLRLVAAGTLPFTIASGDQVIQARSQGLPVVAIASWYRKFPVAIISLADIPLDTPADLRGLRIGTPETFGASYIGLRALLAAGGLTEKDIELQVIGYSQIPALLTETVDAVVVYANNTPSVLEEEGIAYHILYVADYAELVSNVLVTNETMIQEHPERVAAFVKAFLQSLEEVLEDPDAAFEVCKKYVTGLEENAAAQRAVLETTLTYWQAPDLGHFTPEAWATAQQVMLEAGLITQPVPVESLFTNQFVQP